MRADTSHVHSALAAAGVDGSRPWLPVPEALRLARGLVRHRRQTAATVTAHALELGRIAAGTSQVTPASDRRYRDRAWTDNPALRRLAQASLLASTFVDDVILEAELDWRAERRLRLAAANVVDALAPSNNPLLNPTVVKTAVDSGGLSLLRGARRLISDVASWSGEPRLPGVADPEAIRVGENVATSRGAVVARTDMCELVQYSPSTTSVRQCPLLIVPSVVNKFYVVDLAPGRSIVEHLVDAGHQVFAISWRNPAPRHANWGVEAYVAATRVALAAVEEITGNRGTHVAAVCAGGLIGAAAAGYLAAQGEGDRVATFTSMVGALDHERLGDLGALVDERSAAAASEASARRGYVDGRALAGVFAWLRPNDRIWRYWVSNYLLGRELSASDVLFWSADTVNLSAACHRDMLELLMDNGLARPGGFAVFDTPLDLRDVSADVYLVAGRSDHLTPWQAAWRTAGLVGGDSRFILVDAGHVTAVISPPGDARGAYWFDDVTSESPDAWLEQAPRREGSWWPEWADWLHERGGELGPAPSELGSAEHPPVEVAPGRYVRG